MAIAKEGSSQSIAPAGLDSIKEIIEVSYFGTDVPGHIWRDDNVGYTFLITDNPVQIMQKKTDAIIAARPAGSTLAKADIVIYTIQKGA